MKDAKKMSKQKNRAIKLTERRKIINQFVNKIIRNK